MDGDLTNAAAAALGEIRRHWSTTPQAAMILGTGLGRLVEHVCMEAVISYAHLPGFPRTTAIAHRGRLICGTMYDVPLILLDGRCHLYEGYSFSELALPIHVLNACGVRTLIVTNASGGLNRQLAVGDVVVMEDHINLMGSALGKCCLCTGGLRPTRPHATPYDEQLRRQALVLSRSNNFTARQGVYAGVIGPNYETRASTGSCDGSGRMWWECPQYPKFS